MKYSFFTVVRIGVAALALHVSGCASEPDKVDWSCSCSWVRDGVAESAKVGGGCGDQNDAQGVADDATTQCQAELDAVCTTTCDPCSCQCDPGKECTTE